jgi:hypothetical protein
LTAPPVYGADLHFIAFTDTTDTSIGTVDDLNNARTWADRIAANTGLRLQFQSLSGNDLTIQNAWNTLNQLEVASDDVIYFFYSGHGINVGSSKWPVLLFDHQSPDPYMTFDQVVALLQPKIASLLIVIADCCNNYMDSSSHPLPEFLPRQSSALEQQNFKRLFLESQGTILASSSLAGQASLGAEGQGALFTNTFIDTFISLAQSRTDLTWSTVFSQSTSDTKAEAALYGYQQDPQYEISFEEVLAATPPAQCGPIGTGPVILGIIGFALIRRRHN